MRLTPRGRVAVLVGGAMVLALVVWGVLRVVGDRSTDATEVTASAVAGESAEEPASESLPSPTMSLPQPQGDGAESQEPPTDPATVEALVAGSQFIRVALPPSRTGGRRVVRYALEIEKGLKADRAAVATKVSSVLEAKRGWQTRDDVNFVPVPLKSRTRPAITVTIASPRTTDRLCAPLRTGGRLSCWNGSRAVLNYYRWQRGADTYGKDLPRYRIYLINHEVGHGLGQRHAQCPRRGAPAPVMVQQTKSLYGCRANPYP